ncbi:MAG: aminopeptidase N [Bifidobacteriaceae bacterium]|nr:aminopeptidase N [Bifidobacteriaceae bacterium]
MNLSRTEATARAELVTDPYYLIELDLTPQAPWFVSRTTVSFEASQPGASSFIDLIAPEVISASLNGRRLDLASARHDDRIVLDDLLASNTLVVEARCAYSHTGEGLHRTVDPVDDSVYLYTQFEPADACRVFTVFEQPDIKGRFELRVTAPEGWKVISNQPATEQEPDPAASSRPNTGGTVHLFEPTPKLSSYLVALVAGPWAEWHSELVSSGGQTVPLRLFARQSLAQFVDAENLFDLTRRGFAFYEPAFDYPYPFAKYDQVFCPDYNFGAMENAGLVTITERYIFRSKPVDAIVERRAITVLHELAHMWFGDLVTMCWWDDLWLNESFAEFISHLAAVEATTWQDAWTTFAYSEKIWAYRQDQLPTTHPILARIDDITDVHNNFDGITYAKGASVLRQLVAWVGQETFLTGLRAYFKKHAWGNTRLTDLLTELEIASGRDLNAWAEAWLRTAGVNTVAISHDGTELIQTGAPDQLSWRPQIVGLGGYSLTDGQLTRFWDTEVDLSGPVTALPRLRPADVLLVNDSDLAYAKVRLTAESLAVAGEYLGALPDSLARSVINGVLWDMTRDAELGPRVFVDLVLRHIARESNSTARQKLLAALATSLDSLTAPEYRLSARQTTAERLWELVEDAPDGSDAQLQLVRAYALHATTPSQLDRIEELVAGSRSLSGLTIDTDLTWDLLSSLVVAGRSGEAQIDLQLAADPTHTGLIRAAGLRASQPDAEAKAAAWLRAVEDPATPNETLRAVMAGWARTSDPSLLKPFIEPYFGSLVRLWHSRTNHTAADLTEALYPSAAADLPDTDVIGATDLFLDQLGDDLAPLRRLVLEGRAGVVRAKAAQAFDRSNG